MTLPETIETLIETLDSNDITARETAKTALRKLGPAAVDALITAMQTKTSRACWEAARVLSSIDDPRWIAPMEAALTSCTPLLGQVAVAALEPLGEVIVPALIDALPRSHKVVQLQILAALEQIGGPAAVPAIIEVLQNSTSPELRCGAIQALGIVGDVRHVEIVRGFDLDTDHHVRERVQIALERLTEHTAE